MSKKKLTAERFIEKAKEVHGEIYDYSLVDCKGNKHKIKIICIEHNHIFEQFIYNHLKGCNGCMMCNSRGIQLNTEEFIRRSAITHRNKYDYTISEYIDHETHINIMCPTHGIFKQKGAAHLSGKGCKKCAINYTASMKRKLQEDFVKDAKKVHGNKYGYDLVDYKNNTKKIKITCNTHGVFKQAPKLHLRGENCPQCARITVGLKSLRTISEFIALANKIHNNLYDYSFSEYKGCKNKLIIVCSKHGMFEQAPDSHINGQTGCPSCMYKTSKMEKKWLDLIGIPEQQRQIKIFLSKNKIPIVVDGFDPITNTVYEFYGDYWHGNPSKYDKHKTNPKTKTTYNELYQDTILREKKLIKAGYNIISIWESDYKQYLKKIR